ncbi:MAG TPA: L-2-hydroxyglutarate oxidase [Solirubrobacteraceae bacterium]|nr:L-2-hydroxyglutarate oxidase [Solirubrobacteraceae bacterium]
MSVDLAVVGGGLIGLAVAREQLLRRPGDRVVVFERELSLALHQSGRNSGVIHSGLYYTPGSLKARLCREGRARLLEFAAAHEIPHRVCGKVVVATRAQELPRLDELERRALANGLRGVRRLDAAGLRELEPHIRGLAALHVPETGVIDFAAVARAYADEVTRLGGSVRLGVRVDDVRALGARRVVTCGGLWSDRLAAQTGVPAHRISPFRGDFFVLSEPAAALVRGLVYPVPDPRFPFLGVHFTRRIDDHVWAGPNAVPVLGRRLLSPEMRRLMRRYWRTGAGELWRAVNRRAALAELRRFLPELALEDLRRGPSGVRAQVVDRDGTLVDDFVFQADGDVLHVINAPSPAATASLAIASYVVDRLPG